MEAVKAAGDHSPSSWDLSFDERTFHAHQVGFTDIGAGGREPAVFLQRPLASVLYPLWICRRFLSSQLQAVVHSNTTSAHQTFYVHELQFERQRIYASKLVGAY